MSAAGRITQQVPKNAVISRPEIRMRQRTRSIAVIIATQKAQENIEYSKYLVFIYFHYIILSHMSHHRGGHIHDDSDDFYVRGSVAETQRLLVQEQDDTIRGLAASVQRVQGMALLVNEELAAQNRLLEDIDEDVDRTDSKIKSLHGRLARLANDRDSGKYCVIVCLLVVLGILILLVLE